MEVTESESKSGLPEEVFVIGRDLNVHTRLLQQIIDEVYMYTLELQVIISLGKSVETTIRGFYGI